MVIAEELLTRAPCPVVMTSSLRLVSRGHSLRCDAKQAERRFQNFEEFIASVPHFRLGDYLPTNILKGEQPRYIESIDASGVPVISTLAIQELEVREDACRFITEEDFAEISSDKKPRPGDVLLTMDGGTSIGKPVLYTSDKEFAVDSHVAILRPDGLDAQWLVYLLASPIGQLQFQRAESGASGQTGVSEDDIRLFRFPKLAPTDIGKIVQSLDAARLDIRKKIQELQADEIAAWSDFGKAILAAVE